MLSFILNEQWVRTDAPPGEVLLDFIRDDRHLPGTKEACREGECGACTVLIGRLENDGSVSYRTAASCLLPIGDVAGCHVVTVEGLSGDALTAPQRLIVDHSASQCGFCTPGIVLSLTGFSLVSPAFSDDDVIDALDGNLCRCTGYVSIRNAARALAEMLRARAGGRPDRVGALIEAGVLPDYFREIPARLRDLAETEPAAGPAAGAILVAGGTDLFVQKPEALRESRLDFLSRRRDLATIRVDGDILRIGGGVTIEEVRTSAEANRLFPFLEHDLLLHSSAFLRNKATLAGNIVNASPIGDATIMLLALGARLSIEGLDGRIRETPLSAFFLGYKTLAMDCGELVREIAVPALGGDRYNFEKVSNRVTLDIAAVNSAIRAGLDGQGRFARISLAAGGVAAVPLLVPGLDDFLGRVPDEALAGEMAARVMAAVNPIDDIRGSAQYKRLLLGQLVRAHVARLAEPS